MSFNFGELCFISCPLEQLGFSDHTDTNIDGPNALQVSYVSSVGFIKLNQDIGIAKHPHLLSRHALARIDS